jgi:hypothetical protein
VNVNVNTGGADEHDAVLALRGQGAEIARYREERGGFEDRTPILRLAKWSGVADPVSAIATRRLE